MKENAKKKKSGKAAKFLVMLLVFAGSVATGLFIAKFIIDSMGEGFNLGEYYLRLALYLFVIYAAYFLQIIIHESGHLVFGLLTGYRFSSFRIGSVILTKQGGKFRIGSFSMAGTGGQCLLYPPEDQKKIPYVLYNLGGVIMNLIAGAASLALWFVFPRVPVLSVFLMGIFAMGIIIAFTNGIPMSVGMVNNDGYNALSLGKDLHALSSFSNQLRVNARMTNGERLRDMPSELFELPDGADTSNPINATIKVFACNRLMDEGRFAEARALCETLIGDEAVLPIYKNMLTCDLAFCEMIAGECERAASRFNKELIKFISLMAKNPSIVRTQYAHALLCENNAEKAQKYRESFEKLAKKHPYKGDIESERGFLAEVERAVKK